MPTQRPPIKKVDAYRVLQKCGHVALTLNANNAAHLAKRCCENCAEANGEHGPGLREGSFWQITE